MVNAAVDNTPISIQLAKGESTTVPSGETWRVKVTSSVRDETNDNWNSSVVDINGLDVLSAHNSGDHHGLNHSIVLDAGDTIELESAPGSGAGAHISGFVAST